MKKVMFTFACASLFCGCASSKKEAVKPIYERPWIGGKFEMTGVPKAVRTNSPTFGKHGALITTVRTNTPLDKAGLQETDLILAVNGEKVRTEKQIYKRVEKTGAAPVKFTVYRGGEVLEKSVTPGIERYQNVHNIAFALAFSTRWEIDLFPSPNFSLIAAGYKEESERLNLNDAKAKFRRDQKAREGRPENEDGWIGLQSDEGWKTWLGPIWIEKRRVIVSQE